MYSHFTNIDSDINNISLMEEVTRSLVDKYELTENKFPVILIALTEAVSNAILHGNKEDKNKSVTISAKKTNEGIHLCVEDQGLGFDFTTLPDPTTDETIEEEGGRGILLISELCDSFDFHKEGRVIEMFFKK